MLTGVNGGIDTSPLLRAGVSAALAAAPTPGGAFKVGWSGYDNVVEGVVELVEYPTTFSYRWEAGISDDGTVWATLVTFTIEEADGMTTVKVLESGFSALPDELYGQCFQENSSGWIAGPSYKLNSAMTGV